MFKSLILALALTLTITGKGSLADAIPANPIDVETPPVKTIPGPPSYDALATLAPADTLPTGALAYVAFGPVEGQQGWKRFLVMRKFGKSTGQTSAVTSLRVETTQYVFSPQISPDGQSVLFRHGLLGDLYDRHHLFVWNLNTGKVQPVLTESLTYPLATWSPDGKYIAYVQGGDVTGSTGGYSSLQLYIYDVQRRKSRLIARNPALKTISWTQQGTLLYSLLSRPTPQAQQSRRQGKNQFKPAARPDIYEVPAKGGPSRLVMQDGYRPMPSPDGKWIACYTSANPTGNAGRSLAPFHFDLPRQSFLCLYNRGEKKRHIIRSEDFRFSALQWTPDSKSLLTINEVSKSPQAKAQIAMVNIDTFMSKEIATLDAQDYKAFSHPITQPQFQSLGVSPDGTSLFASVTEFVADDPSSVFPIGVQSLRAVNLRSGDVSTIARIKTFLGLDWRAESFME